MQKPGAVTPGPYELMLETGEFQSQFCVSLASLSRLAALSQFPVRKNRPHRDGGTNRYAQENPGGALMAACHYSHTCHN